MHIASRLLDSCEIETIMVIACRVHDLDFQEGLSLATLSVTEVSLESGISKSAGEFSMEH